MCPNCLMRKNLFSFNLQYLFYVHSFFFSFFSLNFLIFWPKELSITRLLAVQRFTSEISFLTLIKIYLLKNKIPYTYSLFF